MALETIKVQTGKEKDAEGKALSTSFEKDFGANLAESVALFGETIVHKLFRAKAIIEVQDVARNALAAGKTPAEAAALAVAHKLGEATRVAKDPTKAVMAALPSMTPEERKAFIKELQAQAAKLAQG